MDDVRKIRDYNSSRHLGMTREEIIADTKQGAAELMATLIKRKNRKRITILSGDRKTIYDPPRS